MQFTISEYGMPYEEVEATTEKYLTQKMGIHMGMIERKVIPVTGEADELMEEGLEAETAKEAMEKNKMNGRQLQSEIVEEGLVKDLLRRKLEDDRTERVEEGFTGDTEVRTLS